MRITANQVTAARLLAMPFLLACVYGGTEWRFVALFLGTAVGFTDLLDGYLARKYGPTVLGGLMDPVADKVFVVTSLLAFGDQGWVPWWLVHTVVIRELLVTALRSSFELRKRTLRSTYLAKVKTWVQMFVLAVVIAMQVVPMSVMTGTFIGIASLATLAGVVTQVMGRRWRGIWIFAGFFVVGTTLHILAGPAWLLLALYVVVAAITWGTALEYVSAAIRELAGARDLHVFDTWRILGALLVAVLPALALIRHAAPAWALLALVISEIFHGGLDNLLAHHAAAARGTPWAVRTLGAGALVAAALLYPALGTVLTCGALALSAAMTVEAFARNRQYLLG